MNKRNLPRVTVPNRPGVSSYVDPTAAQRWNPDLRAAEGEDQARTISILDRIGEDMWGDGVSPKRIAAALRGMGPGPVVVNINSPGGSFFDGLAIYNQLREHPGDVTVRILGVAASAASVIAMAGDRVEIGRLAFLMIHNTQVVGAGDRHGFRDLAEWMEPFDAAMAELYAMRTGKDQAEVSDLLDRETWIGGQAAVDQGFADALLPADAVAGGGDGSPTAELSASAAVKRLDILLAGKISNSERRQLVAALKNSGTPGAAPAGKPGAAHHDLARAASAALNTLKSI